MTHSAMLDELERDVERARARLADDIARLRDPRAMSNARADLMARASVYKDQLVEQVGDAVSERAQTFSETLRQQAKDNPAAVAVMAAGLAWRLWKKPPVASLLLGAGLTSLLAGRGEGRMVGQGGVIDQVREVNRAAYAFGDRAADIAGDLAQQARDFSDQASEAIAEFSEHQRETLRENPVAMGFAAMALGAALALALRRRE